MSIALLLGIIVFFIAFSLRLNVMTYRHGLWYKRRLDGINKWAKLTIKGTGTKNICVKTTDGTFRVPPIHELIFRTEFVPLRQKT